MISTESKIGKIKSVFLVSPLLLIFIYLGFPNNDAAKHSSRDIQPPASTLTTEGAIIYGQIYLPSTSQKQRVYRGSAYRGRGGSSSTPQNTDDDKESNPLENTIISAHPLSYKLETQPLEEPAKINQENATFLPHVTPVTVGTTVQFINDDPFFHNVFSLKPGARFNIGRRKTGEIVSQKIPRIEEVTIRGLGEISIFCDIHSQMNAVILSLDTPYFKRVGKDGTYSLEGLPAGKYELRAYNPQFDVAALEVTVKEGEKVQQDFNISN